MAKKLSKSAVIETDTPAQAAVPVAVTPSRNTNVPPKAKAAKGAKPTEKPTATTTEASAQIAAESKPAGAASDEVHEGMIAERAYELWKSGHPGGEADHWHAAERELRGRK